ncbi:MAG: ABC transporter substrate-binding protein, partial [Candidatus Omnitrophica bacterium]|nr:ABC transporter substrate-binding protein [Candidatus Omnitrophota bacterium]
YEINEYPVGWRDAFNREFSKSGGIITGLEGFDSKETDVRTQLVKIESTKPDAVFLMILNPSAAKSIIKQYRELGLKRQLMGIEVFSLSVVRKGNNDTEGMLVLRYKFDPNSKEAKNYLDMFQRKFNRQPSEEIYGAMAFDTYNILTNAIEKCGNEPDCIKAYLYSVKDYAGASGTISIDKNGDSIHEFVVSHIVNGTLEDI